MGDCCSESLPTTVASAQALAGQRAATSARWEFQGLMRSACLLLLRVDQPYLARCLNQFQVMALATWKETDPAPDDPRGTP